MECTLQASLRMQRYFWLSLLSGVIFQWREATAGNTSEFAGYLQAGSLLKLMCTVQSILHDCMSVWKIKFESGDSAFHFFSGHPNPSDQETGSQYGKSVAVKNGSHPNLSTNSATGYFGQQRDGETTHDTVISSVQMHSLYSAETSSSK